MPSDRAWFSVIELAPHRPTDTDVVPIVVRLVESVTVTLTVKVPVAVYTFGIGGDVPVKPPRFWGPLPSPKSMTVLITLIPEGTVTWIVNVVCVFAFAGTGEYVMMIVGGDTGITLTNVDEVLELPAASVTVPLAVYVPGDAYTCETI